MRRYDESYRDRQVWRGIGAGAVAGLAGALTMNLFQAALSKLANSDDQGGGEERQGDDATVKVASAISTNVADHSLSKSEKQVAGPAVHYAFGAMMGAAYGAMVELDSRSAACWGTGFGSALWAGADEIGVPALGLSAPPWKTPMSTHLSALASHIVYGATVESVRRIVRFAQ